MKTLASSTDRQNIASRLKLLTADDRARWGRMSVRQMVCHLDDAYKCSLGEKYASPATGWLQQKVLKRLALQSPFQWAKGYPTRPEMEQGKGGTAPGYFAQDLASLLNTFDRFCDQLPEPCRPHPVFGPMQSRDWMRWGYLHADHHLRQFGR
jgi:Protein of unknown function (DUF1569)